jgi:hypothetical protein
MCSANGTKANISCNRPEFLLLSYSYQSCHFRSAAFLFLPVLSFFFLVALFSFFLFSTLFFFVFLSVSDIKILLELLHKCKFDDNLPEYATVITIYNDLKYDLISDIHARVTIYEFTHWMAVHPLLIAPLIKLQQHLRKQTLGGESVWITITQQRKDHLEQNRLDFLKTLKTQVYILKFLTKQKKNLIYKQKIN